MLYILLFTLGIILIIKGGDWFIQASIWISETTGMSKMLIGTTLVSLATAMPEFFVSTLAVADNQSAFALGNTFGSVICNTGLVLSLSLIFLKNRNLNKDFFKKAFIMFLTLIILFFLVSDKTIQKSEGIPLAVLFIIFLLLNVYEMRGSTSKTGVLHVNNVVCKRNTVLNIAMFIFGGGAILLGADLLVDNGVIIAQMCGIPKGIIGVTIVAFGTSLPELVTTLSAIIKKETDIGIGNILGANILNLTLILSTCTFVSKGPITIMPDYFPSLGRILTRITYIDIPLIALLFCVLLLPPLVSRGKVFRWQGIIMLLLYIAFIVFLIINLN
ncbi:MAG: calcium/sodium antiporter [Eubacteriales bacterium]